MFKNLKNLVNVVTSKINDVQKAAKNEIKKYQNVYEASQKANPTAEEVKGWISDELDKLNVPSQYLIHFASESDYVGLYQSVYNDTIRYYRKKAGSLNNVKFVRDFITGMGQGAAQRTEMYMGITMFEEETGKDEIIFYVDHIVRYWGTLAYEKDDTPEIITRQVVRHEVRHSWQFTHLRAIGGPELVKQVWNREQSISYTSRATEKDAFGGQRNGYGDISNFIKLVEAEMGMKLI